MFFCKVKSNERCVFKAFDPVPDLIYFYFLSNLFTAAITPTPENSLTFSFHINLSLSLYLHGLSEEDRVVHRVGLWILRRRGNVEVPPPAPLYRR